MYHPIPSSGGGDVEDEGDGQGQGVEMDNFAPSGAPPQDDEDDDAASESKSFPGAAARKKPATIWLVIYFLINSIAFGLTAVPRVNLIVSLVCRHVFGGASTELGRFVVIGGYNPQCQSGNVSSRTALVASYGTVMAGVFSAVVSPLMGRLSDRVGRVRVLVFNMMGLICSEVVLVLIAAFPNFFDYRWLFLAYSLDGLSGSFATAMSLSTAYVSDCNTPDKRNVHIGRVYGAMFIGISVGPLLSSLITKASGDSHPLLVFYICLAMRSGSILYLRFVPESLFYSTYTTARTQPRTNWEGWRSSSGILSVWNRIRALHPGKWLDRIIPQDASSAHHFRTNVILLIVINIIVYGGAMGPSEVLILYPQVAFKWSNIENNAFMAVINAFRALVSAVGLPMLVRVFRKPSAGGIRQASDAAAAAAAGSGPQSADSLDRVLMRTAIVCDIGGFIAYAVSPNGVLYTIGGALAAFGAIGLSTTEAALTKHVDSSHIGELMGGLGLVQGVVRIIAPGTINLIYSWTASSLPQMAFLVVAAVLSFAVLLTFFLKVRALA